MKNGTIPKTQPNWKNRKLPFKIDFYLSCMLELLEENQRSMWKLGREAEGNLKAFSWAIHIDVTDPFNRFTGTSNSFFLRKMHTLT